MHEKNILFICVQNTCRSQMAEAVMKNKAGTHLKVYSAGLNPGIIHPLTLQVLEEKGYETSDLYAKPVSDFINTRLNYVVYVCSALDDGCPVFPGKFETLHWPILDPAKAAGTEEEILTAFHSPLTEIENRIEEFLENL